MKKFLHKNSLFFVCLAVTALVGTTLLLTTQRVDALFFFSGYRSYWLDRFFVYVNKLGEEPMYIFFGLLFLLVRIRHTILLTLTGLTVMLISYLLKSFFAIDRPITYLRDNDLLSKIILIDGVDVHSAATSFPSGHSMSGFALYSMLIFLLPNKKRYVLPLFLMAVLAAVSRVYLVQHFLLDIYVGGLVGVLIAMCLYAIDLRVKDKLDKPLLRVQKFW